MRKILGFTLLALLLAACGNLPAGGAPAVAPAPTETLVPPTAAFTSSPTRRVEPVEALTPTPEFTSIAPTLLPPLPTLSPMITPDAAQVERWKEYQAELAKAVLSTNPELGYDPAIFKDALCEWDILGHSGRKVYVYAACVIANGNGDMRKPAIIYLEPDGSIQKVKLPEPKANSSMFDYAPFPKGVQEKFCYYFDPFPSDLPQCSYSSTEPRPRLNELYAHIEYRKTHPKEPPLVVLLAMQTATP